MPADITEATVTIRPSNGPGYTWAPAPVLDFLGGSVSFEVTFPAG